jgi:hypothetical protein
MAHNEKGFSWFISKGTPIRLLLRMHFQKDLPSIVISHSANINQRLEHFNIFWDEFFLEFVRLIRKKSILIRVRVEHL